MCASDFFAVPDCSSRPDTSSSSVRSGNIEGVPGATPFVRRIQLHSSPVAESLVVHRVDPVLPHGEMMARVSGAVIIAFEITKEGKVRHAMVVSGPKLPQARVLAAVRQWNIQAVSFARRANHHCQVDSDCGLEFRDADRSRIQRKLADFRNH
jgi:hypothetical protein